MKRFRKPILLTLLFVLAGAVMNVAVAWAFAWAWHMGKVGWFSGIDRSHFENGLVWPLPIRSNDNETWPRQPEITYRERGRLGPVVVFQRLEAIGPLRPGGSFAMGGWRHSMELRTYGWPLRSLESRGGTVVDWPEDAKEKFDRAVSSGRLTWVYGVFDSGMYRVDPVNTSVVCFPLRPRSVEFTINSVLFGSSLAGATLGPFALRRWVRRKRGACAECGYSLQGHPAAGVCSECGAKVAGGRAATA